MTLGATLKAAEKVFGPALPGRADERNTLAAVPFAKGKGKKFAGVLGFRDDALFHIHFPVPVDWKLLATKKGTPDFINDLKESGPQGEQGREALVGAFLAKYESMRAKLHEKELAAKRKQEAASLRPRLAALKGEHEASITIGSETIALRVKVTVEKTGKIKIVAAV
jgi:hypothetical protein